MEFVKELLIFFERGKALACTYHICNVNFAALILAQGSLLPVHLHIILDILMYILGISAFL